MSPPPHSETGKPTEDEYEGDPSFSSLHATIASAEEQDDDQGGRMSLLTSSFKFRPSISPQVQDIAEDKSQDDGPIYPADAIVESTEIPCDSPVPILAPLSPPDEEVDTPTERSASKENNEMERYTRAEIEDAIRMRSPESSLPQYMYNPLRLTHPDVRPPSAMEHRTRTPSPDIASERPRTPTPDQNSVLFGKLESHSQSTYTSEPPPLEELDPMDHQDAKILNFADERPMDPSRRTDVDRLPHQGDHIIAAQAVQKGV
jgi:hypothetical protein